ncbi:MAG: hypothetical protein IKD44_11445 [Lentisphaeria bacterium]|nr:hypothetical protein [Lentisphaeria bacterium]
MKKFVEKILWGSTALMLVLSFGCQSGNDEFDEDSKEEDRFQFLRREEVEPHKDRKEQMRDEQVEAKAPYPHPVSKDKITKLEKRPIPKSRIIPGGSTANAPRFYDDFISLNGDEEIPVSLVFNSAPLLDVLSAFADVLNFNFIADNDLRGVVTLNLNSNMTRRELWNTFERMVHLSGAGIKVEDSILRIVGSGKFAKEADHKIGTAPESEILYYPLTTATGREAVNQLRPFMSRDASIVDLTRPNAVLVCDLRPSIAKAKQLLDLIDRNGRRTWPRVVIPCNNVLPSKVVMEMQEILPVLGFNVFKTNDRNELPGSVRMSAVDRLDVVVASAATQEAIDLIREWVTMLDSSDNNDQERIFVYKVRHNRAEQLAHALSVIFNTTGVNLSMDTNTGNIRTQSINSNSVNRNTANNAQRNQVMSRANVIANTLSDKSSNIFDQQVRVHSDGVLNRLVFRTVPRTYAAIKALLDKLDVVPAQVLLQVMVVEVTLTESTQFGLEFSGFQSGNDVMTLFGNHYAGSGTGLNPFITQAVTNAAGTATTATGFRTGNDRQTGGTFVIADPDNPQKRFGYIRALAGNGKVKVISSPQLLVTSHNKANMQVGSSIPILTQGISNSESNTNVTQNYQYKDVGVILEVTPQITSTDLIALNVSQEISAKVDPASTDPIQSPSISTRKVESTMTIANGQTMIIGGLIQERTNDTLDSLPIINKIPILNRLFGSTNASVERSEILVLITGYIVNEKSPIEDMIKRYNDAIKALNKYDSQLGDRPDAEKSKPGIFTKSEFWLE